MSDVKWPEKSIGTSTHGNCCSCTKCHHYHEECKCEVNDIIDLCRSAHDAEMAEKDKEIARLKNILKKEHNYDVEAVRLAGMMGMVSREEYRHDLIEEQRKKISRPKEEKANMLDRCSVDNIEQLIIDKYCGKNNMNLFQKIATAIHNLIAEE